MNPLHRLSPLTVLFLWRATTNAFDIARQCTGIMHFDLRHTRWQENRCDDRNHAALNAVESLSQFDRAREAAGQAAESVFTV
jgi:hypothetical protein